MSNRLTVKSLLGSDRCLAIDDILFTPIASEKEIHAAEKVVWKNQNLRPIFQRLLGIRTKHFIRGTIVQVLSNIAQELLITNKQPPEWISQIPPLLWGQALKLAQLDNPIREVRHICFGDPCHAMQYIVYEDGFTVETIETFNLFRLFYVRQLGYLHDPAYNPHNNNLVRVFPQQFSHTRYQHSLHVQAAMMILMHNNGITGLDEKHGRVAALTHDALTPAGGDTTKLIDLAAFDEDIHYPELFKRHQCADFLIRHDLDPKRLHEIIMNRGILGQLLDIADKIAYLSSDTWAITQRFHPDIYPQFSPIFKELKKDPYPYALWESIKVENGQVYCTDREKLLRFLRLRTLMFRLFYLDAGVRFHEHLIANLILRFLYRQGEIHRDQLLTMTDLALESVIQKWTKREWNMWGVNPKTSPVYKKFKTLGEAVEEENRLLAQGIPMTLIEEVNKIKIPTDWLVSTPEGPRPLYEVAPQECAKLLAITQVSHPVHLYWMPVLDMDPDFHQALLNFRLAERKVGNFHI